MIKKRVINGMHQSNGPQWDVEKYLQAAPGCVTLLHFQMKDDPLIQQHMDHENEGWFVKLRDGWPPQGIPAAPDRLIHVRSYQPNWTALDPIDWARHIHSHLASIESGGRTYNLWDDPLVCVSPANEQNLHHECGEPDTTQQWKYETIGHYQKIAAWNLAFAQEINRLAPNRKALLCWPALAFGHEPPEMQPDGEYTLPEIREAMEAYEILATHPYALMHTHGQETAPGGDLQWFYMLRDFRPPGHANADDPGGLLAQVPDKPLLISETGTFTHSDVARTEATIEAIRGLYRAASESGRVLGITPFIWHSDGAHTGNTIWTNPALRDAFAGLESYMTTVVVPRAGNGTPSPTPEPPTEPSPVPLAEAYRSHVVRPADTLYGLMGARWPEIKKVVPIGDPRSLEVGELLMLPVGHPPAPQPSPSPAPRTLADRLRDAFGDDFEDLRASLPANPNGPEGDFGQLRPENVEAIVIHHTATGRLTKWRTVANAHLRREFAGIGYHLGVRMGKVAYLGDVTTARAHVRGQNHRLIGVVLTGNYVANEPDELDLARLRVVVGVLREHFAREIPLVGHRDVGATKCPGDQLYEALGEIHVKPLGRSWPVDDIEGELE